MYVLTRRGGGRATLHRADCGLVTKTSAKPVTEEQARKKYRALWCRSCLPFRVENVTITSRSEEDV